MTVQVQAQGLVRRFGQLTAVDDVSFSVSSGEVVGLLGANGAGKTTTIRMLIGLLRPSGGSARLLGSVPNDATRRRLGYVPQGLGLYADLTVAENHAFVARSYGVHPGDLPDALASVSARLVGDLPLGLQRQLAFTCALEHRPGVLVLDEPTSGVAPLAASRLWDAIRTRASAGVGVLVSTHSMQEARQCDRLLLMAGGRLVATGTEADIVGSTTASLVRTTAWKDAFEALARSGALVMLAGRDVRVADADPGVVERTLANAGVPASVERVSATIDEAMAALDASSS